MEKIKKLLKEYDIRFRETDKILEASLPDLNRGELAPSVTNYLIKNTNGIVYKDGRWATAKLTQKPEKWVVEKDENHPMWERFKNKWINNWKGDMPPLDYRYFSEDSLNDDLLYFKDHQFLTLDQWAEFYLPKGPLIENGSISFDLNFKSLFDFDGPLTHSLDTILELRKPTDEKLNILYQHHPKYAPPKEGDWGVFWDKYGTTKIINLFKQKITDDTGTDYYITAIGHGWQNFKPFSPELQEMIKKEIDEIK